MAGWIGVDLDGTLAHYGGWIGPDHIGDPIAPMVERIFDLPCRVIDDPVTGTPLIIPDLARARAAQQQPLR